MAWEICLATSMSSLASCGRSARVGPLSGGGRTAHLSLWWAMFCVVEPIERVLKVEEESQIIYIDG